MRVPDFVLPKIVAKAGSLLPATPPQYVLVMILNQLLKKGILPADMSLLADRSFEINVLDAGLTLSFGANEERFFVTSKVTEPDLRFSANTADFARMMLREEDPDTLFFNRKLQIEGDTELGLIIKNLLDSIDWSGIPIAHFFAG
ncbi:ubiquinone anaerobic biosynthesis accessory factor UbiT [Neisseria sp. Ec49-e6-T10]|uniref:ubiquinone anaerobic biosynthesis accessory factor UbiT n=1 Tax=Neisseria sp. Ec49-e6-T10 TaxID=3140744 RepID=UPI003EB745DC